MTASEERLKKALSSIGPAHINAIIEHLKTELENTLYKCADLIEPHDLYRAQGACKELEKLIGIFDPPSPIEPRRAISRKVV